MRIGLIIISHLSKLWKAKLSLLCDVILRLRLQEKFDIAGVKGLNMFVTLQKCAHKKRRLHSRLNSTSTATKLHGHGDERRPTEMTPGYVFPLHHVGLLGFSTPFFIHANIKCMFVCLSVCLSVCLFFQFIMTAVAVALPIPAGIFFPVFLIGKKGVVRVHTWRSFL